MTDVARDKFLRLMQEVDELEERVEELEQKLSDCRGTPEEEAVQRELAARLERLEHMRTELVRVSDGCRRPHPNV
jgi:predicted  nucleic acid-binding Zn-ribbon protein